MDSEEASPLAAASKSIRDAAKYLIATFGAVGAVLVSGLSLTALPSGAHPFTAALGIAGAVLALALLIGLVVSVLTPRAITLGDLAELERSGSSSLVRRLQADESLFVGQTTNLAEFHAEVVASLKQRVKTNEEYLEEPTDRRKTAMEIASARAAVLNEGHLQILDTAVFFQLEERFSPRRRTMMIALALCVVAGAGVFAWASTSPADTKKPQPQQRAQATSLRAPESTS
jgi:hypothetical protein